MRRYFMRRMSMAWFEKYLYLSGMALNLLAVVSIIHLVHRARRPVDHSQRARIELEDAMMCTRHMAGKLFSAKGPQAFKIRLHNEREVGLSYKSQSTYGHTKEGRALEMVRVSYPQNSRASLLFFVVNKAQQIESCISAFGSNIQGSQELECLAAAGEFRQDGSCSLPVNLPSDCEAMSGTLNESVCSVPKNGRILRAGRVVPGGAS